MKKLSLILILEVTLCVSCGNDEPNYNKKTEITRPKDGNGKVFVESGKLIDSNMNFTKEQLTDAMDNYEWELEYAIYYDNNTVSGRLQIINALPIKIHIDKDKKMEYLYTYDGYTRTDFREVTIKEKLLIAEQPQHSTAGSIYFADEFIVVSLDLSEESGRMIMDYKLNREVKGYDTNSLYTRMVWNMVPSNK